ncbi:MAG: hypothetical protein ACWGQW_04560 [bacterium]
MQDALLTTTDNPFDPWEQFEEWRQFDEAHGYYTLSLLARIVHDSDELSDADQHEAILLAMDEIVAENVSGVHVKKVRNKSETVS